MGIDIYKIPEDHSAAVGQTKNEHEKDNEKKEPFYMKWLIVPILTSTRLITL